LAKGAGDYVFSLGTLGKADAPSIQCVGRGPPNNSKRAMNRLRRGSCSRRVLGGKNGICNTRASLASVHL